MLWWLCLSLSSTHNSSTLISVYSTITLANDRKGMFLPIGILPISFCNLVEILFWLTSETFVCPLVFQNKVLSYRPFLYLFPTTLQWLACFHKHTHSSQIMRKRYECSCRRAFEILNPNENNDRLWKPFAHRDSLGLPTHLWRLILDSEPNSTYFSYTHNKWKQPEQTIPALWLSISLYQILFGIGRGSKARKLQKAPYEEPSLW